VGAIVATLLDLVLPNGCAGCGAAGESVCPTCAAELRRQPSVRRPRPAPAGLPACLSASEYDGTVRELILAYKERGRRGLAASLGGALAAVVGAGWPGPEPVVLIPVPATAAAIRARHGDHMLRLAKHAARCLRAGGRPAAVASPLRALPKADSAHLDREQRAVSARSAFAIRAHWRDGRRIAALRSLADAGAVVLVDDVLTTGSTLAAVADVLLAVGVPVAFAATLAATLRRT
jgi:predicted amidophosphoribosyltransferase